MIWLEPVIDEKGIVYKVLKDTLRHFNLKFSEDEFDYFHGINKISVLEHFMDLNKFKDTESVINYFNTNIEKSYFSNNIIEPMNNATELFKKLRENNIKVCLNTGHSRKIANKLINNMGFDKYIDGSVTSDEVLEGRPYPYMIEKLKNEFNIESDKIIKIGDTVADIKEGINAFTRIQIGVLSGADSREKLLEANASFIVDSISDLLDDKYY